MVKQTIILRKRANPKVVNLPNGRSFTSRWERISRKQLPINIRVKKQRTIGPRRNNRMIYLNQAAPALKRIKKEENRQYIIGLDQFMIGYNKTGKDSDQI